MKHGQFLFLSLNPNATIRTWDSLDEQEKLRFGEIEKDIEQRGYESGYEDGMEEGHESGYEAGRSEWSEPDEE